MVLIKEKVSTQEGVSIRNKFSQEIFVLEILKNSRPMIRETNLVVLTKFLNESFEDGVPITMTFMTSNGSHDVGDINHFDNQYICISSVGENSPYDFPINSILKIYCVEYAGGVEGFFCMGKNRNSIYLRNY